MSDSTNEFMTASVIIITKLFQFFVSSVFFVFFIARKLSGFRHPEMSLHREFFEKLEEIFENNLTPPPDNDERQWGEEKYSMYRGGNENVIFINQNQVAIAA